MTRISPAAAAAAVLFTALVTLCAYRLTDPPRFPCREDESYVSSPYNPPRCIPTDDLPVTPPSR